MQRLKAVVEPRYRNGDVGAVRADINAFAADVITFEAALRLLRDKGIAVVFINLSDSNGPFAAVDVRGIDVIPLFIAEVAADILALEDCIAGATGVAYRRDDRRRATLYVANQEYISQPAFAISVDFRPAAIVERDPHRRQRFAILLFADSGNQRIDLQRPGFIGGHWATSTLFIRLAEGHGADG